LLLDVADMLRESLSPGCSHPVDERGRRDGHWKSRLRHSLPKGWGRRRGRALRHNVPPKWNYD